MQRPVRIPVVNVKVWITYILIFLFFFSVIYSLAKARTRKKHSIHFIFSLGQRNLQQIQERLTSDIKNKKKTKKNKFSIALA